MTAPRRAHAARRSPLAMALTGALFLASVSAPTPALSEVPDPMPPRDFGAEVQSGPFARVLENFSQTTTLRLSGHQWDNTLIRNCEISNTTVGIFLKDVSNVVIMDCDIHDLSSYGIQLSSAGSTSNVTIYRNTITRTGGNGIHAAQREDLGINHPGLKILNNSLESTATTLNGGHDHGIYIQSTDFAIKGNQVMNTVDGHGISVRSSGVVSYNVVGNAGKGAIGYFPDHARGSSNTLVIENNVGFGAGTQFPDVGTLALIAAPEAPPSYAVQNFVIAFNTLLTAVGHSSHWVIKVDSSYAGSGLWIYGNLLVNTARSDRYCSSPAGYVSGNLGTQDTSGFASLSAPYDFRLLPGSPALGYATGEPWFPSDNLMGTARSASSLSAGAL